MQSYIIITSTDILLEYEEKITQFYGISTAKNLLDFLVILPNIEKNEPYFKLNLIENDADDNKFVDCAFASNAHYIVTDDKHFNILNKIDFPKISIIKADSFKKILHSLR